jgi:integration host factor subunit alpha
MFFSSGTLEDLLVTLTKEALIRNICWVSELKKRDAAKVVESLFVVVKNTLASGDDVLISGFGKLCVKEKGKRRGRNPKTGKRMMLAERRIVTFKCSPVLKRKLNGER